MITLRKKHFAGYDITIGKDFVSNGQWAVKMQIIANRAIFQSPDIAEEIMKLPVRTMEYTLKELFQRINKETPCLTWEPTSFVMGFDPQIAGRIYISKLSNKIFFVRDIYYQWFLKNNNGGILLAPEPTPLNDWAPVCITEDETMMFASMKLRISETEEVWLKRILEGGKDENHQPRQ